MDQSAKDTWDTSDHKCILIQNPAYKYKHHKFLKSEGLVGGMPIQRLPQKLLLLQTCSSFIISFQLILSTNSFWTWWFTFNCCLQSSWIAIPLSPIFCLWNERSKSCQPFTTGCLHTDGSQKRSTEFRSWYRLKHLMFVISLTCQMLALVIPKDSSAVAIGTTKCPVSAPDLHFHNLITGFVKLLYQILQTWYDLIHHMCVVKRERLVKAFLLTR